jgi:4-amino-4-deoxy-L-arabinose transferase-like glycosyltransferase
MIETSITAWIWMLAAMLASSGAGFALVRFVPWSDTARQAGIPRAFACAIAPFLLGILAVLALGVFRGASHAFHLGVVFAGLLLLCATVVLTRPLPRFERPGKPLPIDRWERVFSGLLAAWVVLLILDTLFMPLMQNDALEYATVGRLLFELRDLLAYPALDPTVGASGFYGPWTHPPLYIALSYIANVFQGHADAPGLMRLISPWCALAATAVVYSMGCLINRTTGLLSALVFLSTPLLFLGAGSALIDPLPVLGMTLVLCTATMVEGSPARRGAVQGLTLGLALWTHSLAVLFVPLAVVAIVVNAGWHGLRTFMHQIPVLLGVAGLVAAWPYCRNLELFGSFISDNPAVFALQKLNWPEYFSMARGLESWPEKIQYGLFKGWFALEAYSLSFWLMTLGAVLYWRQMNLRLSGTHLHHENAPGIFDRLMLTASGVVVVYLCGTALSMLIGIDLMIRNERYLLMLMPCVALLAAGGLSRMLKRTTGAPETQPVDNYGMNAHFSILIRTAIIVILSAQLVALAAYRWNTIGVPAAKAGSYQEAMLQEVPAYRAVDYLQKKVSAEATVFSLKPADMYYSGKRMISYLDPRLIPFYGELDAVLAWQRLSDLGVSHLHIPVYALPPLYNSALQEIMGHHDLSRLVYSSGGYQIYALSRAGKASFGNPMDISPGTIPWTRINEIVWGGRKSLFKLTLSTKTIRPGEVSHSDHTLPFFLRERATLLLSGSGDIRDSIAKPEIIAVTGGHEYLVDLQLEGPAFAQVYLMQYDTSGRLLNQGLIGEIILGRQDPIRQFLRRFIAHPDASSVRIGVGHHGNASIQILKAALVSVER